jgi:hypothetical protein
MPIYVNLAGYRKIIVASDIKREIIIRMLL